MAAEIEIRELTRRFGDFTAVDRVTFDLKQGEVLGFLGPNGAGKSTTMKMVTGFLAPTSGTVRVGGHDMLADPIAAKRVLGYLPEGAPAYPDMTPAGFLDFVAAARGADPAERRRQVARVAERIRLSDVMDQRIETLSKGYKRRLGLAQALLHDPDVLVLDEPTDGLDPNQKHEVRELIREMAAEKAILLSTHILEEVEAVCTRAVIIARGRILLDGTPAALEARSRWHGAVTLRLGAPADDVASRLAALPSAGAVESVGADGDSWHVFPARSDGPLVHEVATLIREAGWTLDELRVERGRLDEVFRDVTAGTVPPSGSPEPSASSESTGVAA